MAHSTDIIAYTYRADIYCPACVVDKAIRTGLLAPAARDLPTEEALDQAASANAIDREDERSFDSGEFPKVVFRDQIEPDSEGHPEQCGGCGQDL